MLSLTAVRGMLRADLIRVLRDRFLIGVTAYLIVMTVAMRWLLPAITRGIDSKWDFDLTPYHPLVVSYLIVQLAPLCPGIIGAFLLLESREDGTVRALLVAPYPFTSYLAVACTVMAAIAATLTVIQFVVIGLALPPGPALIGSALAGSLAAPLLALLVATVARNKIEAFAYMKLFGVGPLLATGAYFLPEPTQWLAALYPPYWASKAYWVAQAGGDLWPLWVSGGLICSAAWLLLLPKLFLRAARN